MFRRILFTAMAAAAGYFRISTIFGKRIMTKRHFFCVCSALAMALVAASAARAGTILYSEDFEVGAGEAVGDWEPLSEAGWKAVETNGNSLTNVAGNPSAILYATDLQGDNRTFQGNSSTLSQWVFTDEPNFSLDVWTGLTVSFMHRDNGSVSYRLGFKVDDGGDEDWYLQDGSIAGSSSTTTSTLIIADTNFIQWTGAPANDASMWSVPAIGGGSAFPTTGQVTAFGMMLVQSESGDRFRFDDIVIRGVPEPGSMMILLAGLAGLLLVLRRRGKE